MSNPYAFDTDIRRGPLSVEYNISLVCSISVRKLGFEVVYIFGSGCCMVVGKKV